VSYGGTWKAEADAVVATVPCGYGDGYFRLLSGRGRMLVRGKSAPVLGRVCMDMTMIDVTGIDGVQVGDEVVIMGTQGHETVSADEIAETIGSINYEVTCMVASRVPRIYLA
jgi:alanine racemase